MTPDEVESTLRTHNVPFTAKDLEYGRQFRFSDGGMLCAYTSEKLVWQGSDSPLRARAKELLEEGASGPSVTPPTASTSKAGVTESRYSNRVFIVYGHDVDAREQLELLLRRMKLEPVVLQNLPSGGQTIIEKLETCSDVNFACVLLTPDDEGHPTGDPASKKHRARQNVVLELGMFLAKLGRKRVAILHKGQLELPSDIHGLLYILFKDRVEEIKERVAAELQEAGFKINIKDLLS